MYILKIKFLIAILCLTVTLVSCSETNSYTKNKDITMKLIPYGTDEFNEFIKQPHKVSLEESWNLYHKYVTQQLEDYEKNKTPLSDRHIKYMALLFFIVDNNYVYSISYPLMKTNNITYGKLLRGVWVNADTGEVKYINNETEFSSKKSFNHWGIGKDTFPIEMIEKIKQERSKSL